MKKIVFILFILIAFQSCAKKRKGIKTVPNINFSGEYLGTFTDVKMENGVIELTLFQLKNGQTNGVIKLKKNNEENSLVTGAINVISDGNIFNGNLIPSILKYQMINTEDNKETIFYDSYNCGWNFYGKIKNNGEITITGKAVPMNCNESNIMEFTVKKINNL